MSENYLITSDDYKYKLILERYSERICALNSLIVEEVMDDRICYTFKGELLVYITAFDDYVQLNFVMPYLNLVDFSNRCEVIPHEGINGDDIISFKLNYVIDVQYGVSLVQQSLNYIRRFRLKK